MTIAAMMTLRKFIGLKGWALLSEEQKTLLVSDFVKYVDTEWGDSPLSPAFAYLRARMRYVDFRIARSHGEYALQVAEGLTNESKQTKTV
jgi:hypothetical protein